MKVFFPKKPLHQVIFLTIIAFILEYVLFIFLAILSSTCLETECTLLIKTVSGLLLLLPIGLFSVATIIIGNVFYGLVSFILFFIIAVVKFGSVGILFEMVNDLIVEILK